MLQTRQLTYIFTCRDNKDWRFPLVSPTHHFEDTVLLLFD